MDLFTSIHLVSGTVHLPVSSGERDPDTQNPHAGCARVGDTPAGNQSTGPMLTHSLKQGINTSASPHRLHDGS